MNKLAEGADIWQQLQDTAGIPAVQAAASGTAGYFAGGSIYDKLVKRDDSSISRELLAIRNPLLREQRYAEIMQNMKDSRKHWKYGTSAVSALIPLLLSKGGYKSFSNSYGKSMKEDDNVLHAMGAGIGSTMANWTTGETYGGPEKSNQKSNTSFEKNEAKAEED